MTAIALVMLGIGCEKKSAAGEGAVTPLPDADAAPDRAASTSEAGAAKPAAVVADALPDTFTEQTVRDWLALQSSRSAWMRFKLEATRAHLGGTAKPSPGGLASWSKTMVTIFEAAPSAPVAPRTMLTALDEAEAAGLYDHWLISSLWRRTAATGETDARDLETLYARFRRHAHTTNALLLAYGVVKPTMLPARAWMSKAGPSAAQRAAHEKTVRDLLAAARDVYAKTDEGTWLRDGAVLLDGKRFGRLDLLITAPGATAAVNHTWLGRIDLPAGRTLSVWNLPELLAPAANDKVKATVKSALAGDEAAALELERALPLAHLEIRAAVKASPNAKGAPRLRMILALFDDVPMPPTEQDDAGP